MALVPPNSLKLNTHLNLLNLKIKILLHLLLPLPWQHHLGLSNGLGKVFKPLPPLPLFLLHLDLKVLQGQHRKGALDLYLQVVLDLPHKDLFTKSREFLPGAYHKYLHDLKGQRRRNSPTIIPTIGGSSATPTRGLSTTGTLETSARSPKDCTS